MGQRIFVDSKPDCLETVVRRQLAYWNDRPSSRKLDEALRRAGCVTFAERVGAELKRIALLP